MAERLDSLRQALAFSELPPDVTARLDRHIVALQAQLPALALDTIPDLAAFLPAIRQPGGPSCPAGPPAPGAGNPATGLTLHR